MYSDVYHSHKNDTSAYDYKAAEVYKIVITYESGNTGCTKEV